MTRESSPHRPRRTRRFFVEVRAFGEIVADWYEASDETEAVAQAERRCGVSVEVLIDQSIDARVRTVDTYVETDDDR